MAKNANVTLKFANIVKVGHIIANVVPENCLLKGASIAGVLEFLLPIPDFPSPNGSLVPPGGSCLLEYKHGEGDDLILVLGLYGHRTATVASDIRSRDWARRILETLTFLAHWDLLSFS